MTEAQLLDGEGCDALSDALKRKVILVASVPPALVAFCVDSDDVVDATPMPGQADHRRAGSAEVSREEKITENLQPRPAPEQDPLPAVAIHLLGSEDLRAKGLPFHWEAAQQFDHAASQLSLPCRASSREPARNVKDGLTF